MINKTIAATVAVCTFEPTTTTTANKQNKGDGISKEFRVVRRKEFIETLQVGEQ